MSVYPSTQPSIHEQIQQIKSNQIKSKRIDAWANEYRKLRAFMNPCTSHEGALAALVSLCASHEVERPCCFAKNLAHCCPEKSRTVSADPRYATTQNTAAQVRNIVNRLKWKLYKNCHTMSYLAISRHIVCMDMYVDMIGIYWTWKSQVLHHVRCIVQWRCAAWSWSSALVHFLELRHVMLHLSV